jgi:uncharacterized protein (DUF4415 family)
MKAKDDELRSEYPAELIKNGVRGKYAKRVRESTNVVRIDDDLQEFFPNAESVNRALREHLAEKKRD